jgi:hypothetical protein
MDQIPDVLWCYASIAEDLVGAGIERHYPIEHAGEPGAVELQQKLPHHHLATRSL